MKKQHQHINRLAKDAPMRESRTARFNLPVRHPALWRFLADQLLSPAMRVHRYRHLSVRMFEDMMDEIDCGNCH